MCKVSDNLKLCTCTGTVASLKHYWIFHRFDKEKNVVVIGEPMLPAFISPEDDSFNREKLQLLLNEGNAFDTDIIAAEKDRLEISFCIGPEMTDRISYGFEFRNGKWEPIEFDPLAWMGEYEEQEAGKIKNPMQRQKDRL
jgi:hypothetical protein